MQPARRARGSAHCTGAAPQVGGGPELLGNHSVTLGSALGHGAHRLLVSPLCDRAEPGPPRVKRGENLTICLLPRLVWKVHTRGVYGRSFFGQALRNLRQTATEPQSTVSRTKLERTGACKIPILQNRESDLSGRLSYATCTHRPQSHRATHEVHVSGS